MAALSMCATVSSASAQPAKRSGAAPCRQGALAIIAMLDRKEDNTADYRHAYDGVVQTCGPAGPAPMPAQPAANRDDCSKFALALLDAIEDGKLNTKAFGEARTRFAQACAPR